MARGASKLKLLAAGSPRLRSESEGEGEESCAAPPVRLQNRAPGFLLLATPVPRAHGLSCTFFLPQVKTRLNVDDDGSSGDY